MGRPFMSGAGVGAPFGLSPPRARGGAQGRAAPPPPPQVAGRLLTLGEAVAIALASQPQIQARLFDYAAARFRVDQAIAPLLPQLAGSAVASRSQAKSATSTTTTRDFGDTLVAQVALSQLLFDFGKNMAATAAAKKLAAVALEDIELQRQLIALAVKEAYTNMLL